MKIYTIYGATDSADIDPQRDWTYLDERSNLLSAQVRAKKLSNLAQWHEIELRGEQDGEIIHHSYWQNGKLEIDMSI